MLIGLQIFDLTNSCLASLFDRRIWKGSKVEVVYRMIMKRIVPLLLFIAVLPGLSRARGVDISDRPLDPTGLWQGHYNCAQGLTGLSLSIRSIDSVDRPLWRRCLTLPVAGKPNSDRPVYHARHLGCRYTAFVADSGSMGGPTAGLGHGWVRSSANSRLHLAHRSRFQPAVWSCVPSARLTPR